MKAAVLQSIPGELVIDDVQIDKPGPREVLVKTAAAGCCHSDLHFMEGKYPYPVPAVMGHESAGIVEAVGSDVTKHAVGDRVGVGCFVASCRECDACEAGAEQHCENRVTGTYNAVPFDITSTATLRSRPS